jgi:hypothetical protein
VIFRVDTEEKVGVRHRGESQTPRGKSVSDTGGKSINRRARLTDDRSQGPFGHLIVIRDGEASMRRVDLAKYDVATSLMVDPVADLLQRLDDITSRDAR